MRCNISTERHWMSEIIVNMPFEEAPQSWQHTRVAVAGLLSVGYAPNTDYLLAIGVNGRGVFDCSYDAKPIKVARDYETDNENQWHDIIKLQGIGIGPIANQIVPIAGIFGGGLPLQSFDHWILEMVSPNWPHVNVLLGKPDRKVIGVQPHEWYSGYVKLKLSGEDEVKALGFSQTGKSFIVAYSHTIHIFSRP